MALMPDCAMKRTAAGLAREDAERAERRLVVERNRSVLDNRAPQEYLAFHGISVRSRFCVRVWLLSRPTWRWPS